MTIRELIQKLEELEKIHGSETPVKTWLDDDSSGYGEWVSVELDASILYNEKEVTITL